jgi:secreted trypsin-like serine protease
MHHFNLFYLNPSFQLLGDSGGPLVDKESGLLVGVMAFGDKKCTTPYPSAYVRVSSYYWWIKQRVCAYSAMPPASFECAGTTSKAKSKSNVASKGKGMGMGMIRGKTSKGSGLTARRKSKSKKGKSIHVRTLL